MKACTRDRAGIEAEYSRKWLPSVTGCCCRSQEAIQQSGPRIPDRSSSLADRTANDSGLLQTVILPGLDQGQRPIMESIVRVSTDFGAATASIRVKWLVPGTSITSRATPCSLA